MLKVMLCGASDTDLVAGAFVRVVREFGGEPWHYVSGQITYLNSATSSWLKNSRRSVASADLCVFVVIQRYGEITWSTELGGALEDGTPFVILCLSSTYAEYLALKHNVDDRAAIRRDRRNLVVSLSEIESERNLTVVSFEMGSFADVLRREVSRLFVEALGALSLRMRREALAGLLGSPELLTTSDLASAEEVAIDESEDKRWRKLAVLALAARGVASEEAAVALVASPEQGIQRLAIQHLARLYRRRPPEPEFLADCVAIANESDDVGVQRRLISVLFEFSVDAAVEAVRGLDMTEIGTRRRVAGMVERHEREIVDPGVRSLAVEILAACTQMTDDSGWLAKARACMERLKTPSDPKPET